MARKRPPIIQTGRLVYLVPSFSGSRDADGDLVEYLVDLEPFRTWRYFQTKRVMSWGEEMVPCCEVITQPFKCDCPDFEMRPLHPCKHIRQCVEQFFPEYYIPPLFEILEDA